MQVENQHINRTVTTMGCIDDWIEVLRPYSFTASIVPVVIGGMLAYNHGIFHWPLFLFIAIGVVFLHGASNMVNEYYDVKNNIDNIQAERSSKVLLEKRIVPKKVRFASIFIMGLFMAAAIFYGVALSRWGMPIFAGVGIFCGYFYTAPPISLKYRGLGLVTIFFVFGSLLIQAVYYSLVGSTSTNCIWMSLPISFLVTAILHGNENRDIEHDKNIMTLAGIIGVKKGIQLYIIMILIPYLLVLMGITFSMISPWSLLTFISLPMAFSTAKKGLDGIEGNTDSLEKIDVKTVKLHLAFGIPWIIAIML